MQRADLVAVRIAHVGKIQLGRTITPAGGILDALAARGNSRIVEGLHLLGRVAGKADRAAIGMAGCLAIDRLADAEDASLGAVEDASLGIGLSLGDAER